MSATMPAIAVLIACKVLPVPHTSELDKHNATFTGHQPTQWQIVDGKLQCRRHEVALTPTNPSADQLTRQQCFRTLPLLGVQWDEAHSNTSWRVFRAACPTPVMDTQTGEIIAWHMPDCGMREKLECEIDIAI